MTQFKDLVEHVIVSGYQFDDENKQTLKNTLRRALIYRKIAKSKQLNLIEKYDAIMEVHRVSHPKGASVNFTYQIETFLNRI